MGLGWWGSTLAEGAVAAGAEIAGGFARNAGSRHVFVAAHDGTSFESYEDVLGASDVDSILLATTPETGGAEGKEMVAVLKTAIASGEFQAARSGSLLQMSMAIQKESR